MDDLRLILLLFGAGVIAAVYAWTRFNSRKRKSAHRTEPVSSGRIVDEPDDVAIQQELERMQSVMDGKEEPPAARYAPEVQDERIVIISIVAPEGQLFSGEALQKALDKNDLQHGDKRIFHRTIRRNSVDEPVFSLANMVKPGDFGNGDLRGFSTPGVTLFLELPGPVESIEAFDDFVQTAERLAVELGGQLHDQKHCVITHQALMQMREQLAESLLHTRATS
jgi:cell division protein ZipA